MGTRLYDHCKKLGKFYVAKKYLSLKLFAYLLFGFGVVLFGLSIFFYEQQPSPPPLTNTGKGVKGIQTGNAPSSIKPAATTVNNYTVPPELPKYINIPAIGVRNAMVIELGLLKTGSIATPDNIYETGWYRNSALPGKPGAMFIYGHVSSWTADGIFYNLRRLVPGDSISVTRGDNTVFHYVVVATRIYPYNNVNMHQVLSPISPKVPGLNLMTCTGRVMPGTSEFNERLVVFTKQISL